MNVFEIFFYKHQISSAIFQPSSNHPKDSNLRTNVAMFYGTDGRMV